MNNDFRLSTEMKLSISSALLCCLSLVYAKPHENSSQRNVVFILVDDLRPSLGCYSDTGAYTPNIDAFAERSMVFTQAYAQQALCGPSRTSMLTSRRPDTLGQYDVHRYWRQSAGNFTSLPQLLRSRGYHTASFGKIFHPGHSSNWSDDQPYSWSQKPYHPPTERFKDAAVCNSPGGRGPGADLICPVDVKRQPTGMLPDLQTVSAAKLFLRRHQNSSDPFFLAVGFHKPHIPLKYPKKYLHFHPLETIRLPNNRWRPSSLPDVAWNNWLDVRRRDDIAALNVSSPWGKIPDDTELLIWQSYYAAVTYIDDLVGQLLGEIDDLGFRDNTVVVLTSDHGWSLGEHGEWSKYSNYDSATRVPLIINIPTFGAGRSELLVELVDIAPTLTDIAGFRLRRCPPGHRSRLTDTCTEGLSLLPLLREVAGPKPTTAVTSWRLAAFSQYPRPGTTPTNDKSWDQPELSNITVMGYSMRTSQYRYTEWVHFDPATLQPDWHQLIAAEMYDSTIDPAENLNLADRPQVAEIRKNLSRELRAGWRHALPPESDEDASVPLEYKVEISLK